MLRLSSSAVASEKAASLLEFALILPLLLTLTLGVLDLGRGYRTYLVITNGAREGARHLSLHANDASGAANRALQEVGRIGLTADDLTIIATPGSPGDIVSVRIQHDFDLLFGLLNQATIPFDIAVQMTAI